MYFITGAPEGSTESGSVDGRPILPIIHISTFIMSRYHLTIRLFIKFNEKAPYNNDSTSSPKVRLKINKDE